MNATVKRIVELLFQDVEMTDEVKALEEEILNNCQDRYEDQIAQGRSEDDAIAAVVDSLKGMEDVLAEYRKRSPEQESLQEAKTMLDGVMEQLSEMAKTFGKLGSQFATAMMGDEDDEYVDEDEDDDGEHADEDDEDDAHGSETITIKLGGSRKYNGEDADEDEHVLTFEPAQIETLQFNLLDETVEVTEGTADTVVVRYDKDTSVEVSQKEGVLLFEHKSTAKRQNKSAGLSAKLLQIMIRSVGGDIQVEVPHGKRFTVQHHSTSGDLTLENVTPYAVYAETTSGDMEVRLSKQTAGVVLKSTSGDIAGEFDADKLYIQSMSGDVDYRGTTSDVTVSTVSGDIQLDGNLPLAKLTTVSGDVTLYAGAESRKVDVHTTSGDIDARVAPSVAVHAEISSISGDVTNRVPDAGPASQLQLRAKTVSGDVRVR